MEIKVIQDEPKGWHRSEGFPGLNFVLSGKGFYLSYNPGQFLIPGFSSDFGGGETALCKEGRYYILNGDFRREYEALVGKGFQACKKFYLENKDRHGSSWSTDSN